MEDFPGNSFKKQISEEAAATEENSEQTEQRKTPTSRKPKKSFGTAFKGIFTVDGRSFVEHLIYEVLIPEMQHVAVTAVKDIAQGFGRAFEQGIYGKTGRTPTTSYGTGRPVTNYTSYSRATSSRTVRATTRREPRTTSPNRRSNRVEDVFVNTREEGMVILRCLDDKISETGFCSVGDFYDLAPDITPRSSDYNFGWGDLDEANVEMISRDEYLIRMPPPDPLDR